MSSSTIEKKDNTMPSAANLINMISGIYTSPLWEEVRYYASSLATLRKIQKAIIALQECGKSAEAFGLVIALHDLTDLDVPEAIMGLEPFPDGINWKSPRNGRLNHAGDPAPRHGRLSPCSPQSFLPVSRFFSGRSWWALT